MQPCLFLPVIASVLAVPALPDEPLRANNYQKMADQAKWLPPEKQGLLGCLASELDDYRVEVIRRKGGWGDVTIRVVDNGKPILAWSGHLGTVFLERDGVLYYADFCPGAPGCAVVGFDLKVRKRLWRSNLKAMDVKINSKYWNDVRLEPVNDEVLAVYGKETAGRYVEIVDRKTGKTVGHKIFRGRE